MLINLNIIRLIRLDGPVRSYMCSINRIDVCGRRIDYQTGEEATTAITRAVVASIYCRFMRQVRPRVHAMTIMPMIIGLMMQPDSIR